MAVPYNRIHRHSRTRVNKSDTMWNWSFNTLCKSLKGILFLFKEEKSFARDTSKFHSPKIQKVSVTVKGKPNQLYTQGMRLFEQYDGICKHFAEGKQKDIDANEIQKHLKLHDLSTGEYLNDKYGLMARLEDHHRKHLTWDQWKDRKFSGRNHPAN